MSPFRVAKISPMELTPQPLPGGVDYHFIFNRCIECLSSPTSIASFSDSFEGTNAALPKCNDTFVIKIPLLIPFVQSTVNPRLKSRVNCLSCITASLCSGSLDLGAI